MADDSSATPAKRRTAHIIGFSLAFLLPFTMIVFLGMMFISLSSRLTVLEQALKITNIERNFAIDDNDEGAIEQYKGIKGGDESALVQARIGLLIFKAGKRKCDADKKCSAADREKYLMEAVEHLNKAKKLDSDCFEAYRALTYVYAVSGKGEEAVREGKEALRLNAKDAATYNNLAWVRSQSSDTKVYDLKLAEAHAIKAVELTVEKFPTYLDTLAWVYYRSGDANKRDLAREYLWKAIKIAPRNGLAYYIDRFKEFFPNDDPLKARKEGWE